MHPDNHHWIQRLGGAGGDRDAALAELRQLLLRRLEKTFRHQPELSGEFIEDIAQDALLKILNKLDSFEGRSQFATWATTIAIRTAYSELRKKKWKDVSLEQVIAEPSRALGDASASLATPAAVSDHEEMIGVLHQAIRQDLTPRQRDTLLAELGGMPLEEIARRMSTNTGALYKLMHDARKRLKTSLESRGYSSEDWRPINS